jgi:hypothetical protein
MPESHSYQNPVAQLLSFRQITNWNDDWIDYAAKFGFTEADVPELIRLCSSEDWDDEFAGDYSIHALRAATQLDPQLGLDTYVELLCEFPDDEYLKEEVYGLSKQVGEIAIAPLTNIIDSYAEEPWLKVAGICGLEEISKAYPDLRDSCVQILIDRLKKYRARDDDIVNSTLINSLIILKAVEASDLIAEVFANVGVDEFVTGSWASVQVELGLKQESDFSPEELEPDLPDYILNLRKESALRKSDLGKGILVGLTLPTKPVAKGFGSAKKDKKDKGNKKKNR